MTNTIDPQPTATPEFHGIKINADGKLQFDHLVLDAFTVSRDPSAPAPHAAAHMAYEPQLLAEGTYVTFTLSAGFTAPVTLTIDGDSTCHLETGN